MNNESKELARDFILAMIQRGYFDSEADRPQKIIETYKHFFDLLKPPKPSAEALKNLRESM